MYCWQTDLWCIWDCSENTPRSKCQLYHLWSDENPNLAHCDDFCGFLHQDVYHSRKNETSTHRQKRIAISFIGFLNRSSHPFLFMFGRSDLHRVSRSWNSLRDNFFLPYCSPSCKRSCSCCVVGHDWPKNNFNLCGFGHFAWRVMWVCYRSPENGKIRSRFRLWD